MGGQVNKAIELDLKNAMTYNNRGNAYSDQKQYEKAIKDFNKAIEQDPKYSLAYHNRGITYSKQKQYEEAIKDYNKAIELDPKDISPYQNLSEAYIISGDYKNALETNKKSLPLCTEIEDKAICVFLESIVKKLLNMDTSKAVAELDELLKNKFALEWSFDEIESWLEKADIPEETKKFIYDKIELLKRHG